MLLTTTGALLTARAAAFRPSVGVARAYSRTSVVLADNPKVFFDMEVGGDPVGRIEFELRADVVPKVCLRSVVICLLGFFFLLSPRRSINRSPSLPLRLLPYHCVY